MSGAHTGLKSFVIGWRIQKFPTSTMGIISPTLNTASVPLKIFKKKNDQIVSNLTASQNKTQEYLWEYKYAQHQTR